MNINIMNTYTNFHKIKHKLKGNRSSQKALLVKFKMKHDF